MAIPRIPTLKNITAIPDPFPEPKKWENIRHVLYNCSASRPGIEGKTNEESREVQTETLTVKATPLPGGMVKAKTGNTTNATVYEGWYSAVYMPAAAPDNENGEETV